MKRKAVNNILFLITIISLLGLLAFSNVERSSRKFNIMEVEMNYSEGDPFMNQEEIEGLINESVPELKTMAAGEIRAGYIEEMLKRQIYIKDADVSMNLDGVLNVKVTPRRAIARLIDTSGFSCYMEADGFVIPWSSSYSARVPVFLLNHKLQFEEIVGKNHAIRDINDSVLKIKPLSGIYCLASYLDSSEFWRALIDQVVIGDNVELIPRVGEHRVVLGSFTDIEEKLDKLKVFYREGLNKVGWNKYSIINLKFKGQVIATAEILRNSGKVNESKVRKVSVIDGVSTKDTIRVVSVRKSGSDSLLLDTEERKKASGISDLKVTKRKKVSDKDEAKNLRKKVDGTLSKSEVEKKNKLKKQKKKKSQT